MYALELLKLQRVSYEEFGYIETEYPVPIFDYTNTRMFDLHYQYRSSLDLSKLDSKLFNEEDIYNLEEIIEDFQDRFEDDYDIKLLELIKEFEKKVYEEFNDRLLLADDSLIKSMFAEHFRAEEDLYTDKRLGESDRLKISDIFKIIDVSDGDDGEYLIDIEVCSNFITSKTVRNSIEYITTSYDIDAKRRDYDTNGNIIHSEYDGNSAILTVTKNPLEVLKILQFYIDKVMGDGFLIKSTMKQIRSDNPIVENYYNKLNQKVLLDKLESLSIVISEIKDCYSNIEYEAQVTSDNCIQKIDTRGFDKDTLVKLLLI